MMRVLIIVIIIIAIIFFSARAILNNKSPRELTANSVNSLNNLEDRGEVVDSPYPLSIEYMRQQQYPGSNLTLEQTLPNGSNYNKYIASYKSDGLKIYALLTVPQGEKPSGGWPVIIFNHGYIVPSEYRTTEKYIAYADAFSRNGYIVLKSDYRGHGNSEGNAPGGYGSPAYTIDILNAISSIKKFRDVDINRIGMWGHSMGGFITLRSMVISKDIKAGVIWAGVVASYPDLISRWRRSSITPIPLPSGARRWRDLLAQQFGSPQENPEFWNSISANAYLKDISGPIQLHHGGADTSVPLQFSEKLDKDLKTANKESELFVYRDDDHNIANNFNTAIQRSVDFFDKYLK
ncbi:MAG: hypothetical protein US43_C0001G0005 [Candidatus Levybacteria bacterium GW2011_GWA1_37_16]|nr:MAG: hypothetical protein US43_C0001G0005 [Candidatus Levybacteria bacterium GW2011_GWA1_37_16]KKQ42764.1 MAG: hypothetical protein US59_C0004G0004 [Candidatus Levybacteria bacterium GW2011_GWB1_37_8]